MSRPEPGLRERKKAETRTRIHKEGLRLFGEKGFAETTIAEIAAAADVSVRTVFVHCPSKEDIVFGDAKADLEQFEAGLDARPAGISTLDAVRAWIAERKRRLIDPFAESLAKALARDFDAEPDDVRVRLGAAAFVSGLLQVEAAVTEQLREDGTLPSPRRLEALLDETDRFVRAGFAAPRS